MDGETTIFFPLALSVPTSCNGFLVHMDGETASMSCAWLTGGVAMGFGFTWMVKRDPHGQPELNCIVVAMGFWLTWMVKQSLVSVSASPVCCSCNGFQIHVDGETPGLVQSCILPFTRCNEFLVHMDGETGFQRITTADLPWVAMGFEFTWMVKRLT